MSVETGGDCSLLMAGSKEGLSNTTQTLQETTSEKRFCGCLEMVKKQNFFVMRDHTVYAASSGVWYLLELNALVASVQLCHYFQHDLMQINHSHV